MFCQVKIWFWNIVLNSHRKIIQVFSCNMIQRSYLNHRLTTTIQIFFILTNLFQLKSHWSFVIKIFSKKLKIFPLKIGKISNSYYFYLFYIPFNILYSNFITFLILLSLISFSFIVIIFSIKFCLVALHFL